jgi:uridylate kinase
MERAWSMKAVVKIGGFAFPGRDKGALVGEYVKLLKELADEFRLVVVAGGGEIARTYIGAARELHVPESLCDQLGILVSRLNARLLVDGLGEYAFPEIPTTIDELKHYYSSGKIVAMGGLTPGHSTNAVAALAAETIRAERFVNATDVDGVYTADPSKDPSAKRLEKVSLSQLMQILSKNEIMAGAYELMDPLALRIIQRSKIPTAILNGRSPSNVLKALRGEAIGTHIIPD